jgi:hypothetical protein
MSRLIRFAMIPAALAALTLSASAMGLPTVPQSELTAFCHEYGAARAHLATFFLDDGLRLRGHVNCTTQTFTLSMILPPIE